MLAEENQTLRADFLSSHLKREINKQYENDFSSLDDSFVNEMIEIRKSSIRENEKQDHVNSFIDSMKNVADLFGAQVANNQNKNATPANNITPANDATSVNNATVTNSATNAISATTIASATNSTAQPDESQTPSPTASEEITDIDIETLGSKEMTSDLQKEIEYSFLYFPDKLSKDEIRYIKNIKKYMKNFKNHEEFLNFCLEYSKSRDYLDAADFLLLNMIYIFDNAENYIPFLDFDPFSTDTLHGGRGTFYGLEYFRKALKKRFDDVQE